MESVNDSKYSWASFGILGTPSSLDNSLIVEEANIEVDCLPTVPGKRICSSFGEFSILFYEFIFTRINL